MPRSATHFTSNIELSFFEQAEFETTDNLAPQDLECAMARNGLRLLMMGWHESWQDVLAFPVFKAVLIARDERLLKAMRMAFQQGFIHLYEQLQSHNYKPLEHPNIDLYLANCLALLPYSDLKLFESVKIPQYIEGSWQLVEYQITPIELTSQRGLNKLFVTKNDRVFAYGLKPVEEIRAHCHLIFMGTTYPAGHGFFSQVATDLEAFATPGHKLYKNGRKRLLQWLEEQDNHPIDVCGVSLGGSLSLLLAMDVGDKLNRVISQNPPGIYSPLRKKSSLNRWQSFDNKPDVIVQKQGRDVVSLFGEWQEDWTVFHVQPPINRQGPNGFVDHALNYAGMQGTEFKEIVPCEDNNKPARKLRNSVVYTWLRALIYYCAILPYQYLLRPVVHFVLNHKIASALFFLLSMALLLNPVLSAGLSLPFLGLGFTALVNAMLPALGLSFLLERCFKVAQLIIFPKDCNNPYLTSTQIAALALAFITGLLVTASLVIVPTLGLALASFINPLCAALLIPVAIYSLYKLTSTLFKTFRMPAKTEKCHHPKVSKNDEVDSYISQSTHSFTHEQLNHYYWVKKRLVNNTSYSSHILSPESQENHVTITASAAKITHIKTISTLASQYGLFQQERASVASQHIEHLEQLFIRYKQGKVT